MHYTVASLVQAAFGRIRSLRTPRGTRASCEAYLLGWQPTNRSYICRIRCSFVWWPAQGLSARVWVCVAPHRHRAMHRPPRTLCKIFLIPYGTRARGHALKVKPLNRGDLTPCQKISAVYLKQSKFNFRGELYSMLSPSETVEFSRVSGSTGSGSVIGAVPPAGTSAGRMAGRVYARRHTKRQVRTESRAPTRTSCSSCCSRAAAAGGGGSTSAPELPSAPR